MTTSPPPDYHATLPASACTPEGMAQLATTPPAAASTPGALGTPLVPGASVRARLRHEAERPRFTVGEMLGMGATGEVYTVEDTDLDRRVALKILRSSLASESEEVSSFLHEATTTARLSHPNILPVLDFNLAQDGRPYFTMHRVHGRTLLDALTLTGGLARTTRHAGSEVEPTVPASTAPAPTASVEPPAADAATPPSPAQRRRAINRIVSIAIGICHGLGYAHAQGIIHQDIKPENILLGDFGEVLILDWGSAGTCGADGRVEPSRLYGTPLYMSPEQARRSHADARSDVYALGATLFHALVGRVPWWRPEPTEFWDGKRTGRIDPLTAAERRQLPPELVTIIAKAMAPDPGDRYPTAVALRRDLEQFQAGLTVSAHHYAPWALAWRWIRQHPGTSVAASVALCALAALAVTLAQWRALEARTWHRVENIDLVPKDLEGDAWRASHDVAWGAEPKPLPLPSPLVTVEDGWLTLDGHQGLVDVAHTPPVRGNERITWEARNPDSAYNLNCFFGGDNRTQGITIHVGGFQDATLVLMTEGVRQLERARLRVPLQEHHPYRFQLEHEDQHLRFSIDDQLIFDHLDVDDALGAKSQTFGFDTYAGSRLQVRHIQVDQQTPGQLVSPLLTPDRLAQLRLWPEAIRDYRDLVHSYPGTPLATIAAFHAAECTASSGDVDSADRLYAAFIAEHRGDALVPYALEARLTLALARKDSQAVQALREALVAFPGHPLLDGVLWQISQELATEVPDGWKAAEDPSLATSIIATVHRYDQWRTRYGMPQVPPTFLGLAIADLRGMGRPDLALELLPPNDPLRCDPLLDEGRVQEAAAVDTTADVDWIQGRSQEIAHDPHAEWGRRQIACADIGDFALLRQVNPYAELLYAEHLNSPADGEAYLAHHPLDETEKNYGYTTRVEVLLHLHRSQEILASYPFATNSVAGDLALVEMGRIDDALAPGHASPSVRTRVAIRLIGQGEAAKAREIFDAERRPLYYNDNLTDVAVSCLLPALIHAAAGDHDGARRLLEAWTANKNAGKQRSWYLTSFVLGRIDAATFRQQPYQRALDQWLTIAEAARCEMAGDLPGARAQYRRLLQVPLWHRDFMTDMQRWIAMRLHQVGEEVPWNWGIQLILIGGSTSTR